MGHSGGGVAPELIKKGQHIGRIELIKLQAEGKLAGSMPLKMEKRQLREILNHARPQWRAHPDASVGMWVSNTTYGYLLGQTKNGKKNLAAVNTEANGCYYPVGIKVDHNRNVWAGCEYNSAFTAGVAQQYGSSGVLTDTYTQGCPNGQSGCSWYFSYAFDVAANSSYVFSPMTFFEYAYGSTTYYGAGFEYWPVGSPSSAPNIIALPYGAPVYDVYYMDVDSSNNIYFDYYGCESYYPYTCGYGLAEIANAASSWSFTSLLPPGSLGFAGGVYISNGGTMLNVTDQVARTTVRFPLPWTGGSTATLGPTLENAFSCGDPVTGGFNSADSVLLEADACSWLDTIKVSSNLPKQIPGVNFTGVEGAAYATSDK